ncbi:amidohydrolase family protein [Candidatus Kuenenia stuttgartensis]|uniref:amidohydrolase family protein n=1 Tax=Kuenenia stuttgartiensis TaxID=174633 RepID=UPI001469C2C5|nr:amidohydrolase family protein [Candidatus Kuenenia stuttgartiensis]
MDLDLIIEKGLLIDGTGMPGKKMDVGIKGNKIEVIDDHISCNTCTRIDAEGMIVAPGFIDIHSHSDFLWLACRESESKILDGVTTEVCGNCGLSAFPLRGKLLERRRQGLSKYGIVPSWRSAQGFFDVAEGINSSVNRAFLVGHGNIRACALGYDGRLPLRMNYR